MRAVLFSFGAVALLGAVAVLALAVALHGLAPDGLNIVINDRAIDFGGLAHSDSMGAGLGTLLAIIAAMIVVPIALLVGVLLPLLLLAGALLLLVGLALGVGLIGMAPLLVPLLFLFWLWRRAQRRAALARRAQQDARAERPRGDTANTIDL